MRIIGAFIEEIGMEYYDNADKHQNEIIKYMNDNKNRSHKTHLEMCSLTWAKYYLMQRKFPDEIINKNSCEITSEKLNGATYSISTCHYHFSQLNTELNHFQF